MRMRLEYFLGHNLLPITMETNSFILKKILDCIWEVPKEIALDITRIKHMMENNAARVEHIFGKEINC